LRRRVSGWLQAAYRPYIRWWMGRERVTRIRGLRITVPLGVFPPRLFHSTKLVCRTVANLHPAGDTFLEVGCGSGAVSLVAAKHGASVTAIDISDLAVRTTRSNAAANGLTVDVRESDLFAAVDGTFDLVVITPPFFRHDPTTQLDHAFHAGANFEYFHRLFADLGEHLHPTSRCLLSLAEGCDTEIGDIAAKAGYELRIMRRWMVLLQWTYVFDVVRR
jgi:release factor glutamine methyltransferase